MFAGFKELAYQFSGLAHHRVPGGCGVGGILPSYKKLGRLYTCVTMNNIGAVLPKNERVKLRPGFSGCFTRLAIFDLAPINLVFRDGYDLLCELAESLQRFLWFFGHKVYSIGPTCIFIGPLLMPCSVSPIEHAAPVNSTISFKDSTNDLLSGVFTQSIIVTPDGPVSIVFMRAR